MKTTMTRNEDRQNAWHLVDGTDKVVGRLATRIARVLMGKHKPTWTPHVDDGDFVVVTNAEKVKFTGKKALSKTYRHYTGYMGGLRERSVEDLMEKDPTEVLHLAVKRMMPKTRLGRQMLKKLKIYAGPEHPHKAQDPQTLDLSKV